MKNIKKLLAFGLCIAVFTSVLPLNFSYGGIYKGDGSLEHPYLISSVEDLNNIRNNLNANYSLTCDINFTEDDFIDVDKGWIPIGNQINQFKGTLDGNGYTIHNLRLAVVNVEITREDDPPNSIGPYGGLFGYNSGEIKNLTIDGCSISYKGSTSAIIGSVAGCNNGLIKDCISMEGNITSPRISGGIAGINTVDATIYRCINKTNIYTTSIAHEPLCGGVAGDNFGIIKESYNTGKISGATLGGICGNNEEFGMVENSFNTGLISGELGGGIVGYNQGTVSKCYSAANIMSKYNGGIVSNNVGSIQNSYYYQGNCEQGVSVGIKPENKSISFDELNNASSFQGFDFNNTWHCKSGYNMPMLKNVKVVEFPNDFAIENDALPIKCLESKDLKISYDKESYTNFGVYWNSSDKDIASVDQNGVVSAVNPGKCTISATSLLTGKIESSQITVNPINIQDVVVEKTENKTYSSSEITPQPILTYKGKTLVNGEDYKLSYMQNTCVGTASIIITGMNRFSGTLTSVFNIERASISNCQIDAIYSQSYTGKAITPEIFVRVNGKLLSKEDYDISYENNINPGIANITITGLGCYKGVAYSSFVINPLDISKSSIEDINSFEYDGKEKIPKPKVVLDGKELIEGEDFIYSYKNNLDASDQATIYISGKGKYCGQVIKHFTILPADINNSIIENSEVLKYNGAIQTPQINIAYKNISLVLGKDYELINYGQKHVGIYELDIKGTGNYKGTIRKEYRISKELINKVNINLPTSSPIDKKLPIIKITLGENILNQGQDYEIIKDKSLHVGINYVKFIGVNNLEGEITKKIIISPATTLPTAYLYGYNDIKVNWKISNLASGYKVYYKKTCASKYNVKKIIKNNTVSLSNLYSGSSYYIKIIPYVVIGGVEYNGSTSKTIKISTLKKTAIKKIYKYKKGLIKITFNNVANESGYQIYSSKHRSYGFKLVKTVNSKYTSCLLKKNSYKTYYKIRAYKLVGKKRICTPFSSIKKY